MESIRDPVLTKRSRAEGKKLKDKIFVYLQLTRFPNLFMVIPCREIEQPRPFDRLFLCYAAK